MKKIGFDNDKYIALQSEKILERINSFGGKLYLEFGGKLFDDHHAARVLPGFMPDSKLRMLEKLKERAEIVLVISAGDIEKNKQRGDFKAKRYIPAVAASVVMILLMVGMIALMLWAFRTDPLGAPPWPLLVLLIGIPAVIILGVLLAVIQRWKEIGEGEEDEARKY